MRAGLPGARAARPAGHGWTALAFDDAGRIITPQVVHRPTSHASRTTASPRRCRRRTPRPTRRTPDIRKKR